MRIVGLQSPPETSETPTRPPKGWSGGFLVAPKRPTRSNYTFKVRKVKER